MSMTMSELRKNVDRAYDKLTPKERARMVSAGLWEIADAWARGEEIAEQQEEHRRFIDRYVAPLTNNEFIRYLIALADCDGAEWGRRYHVTLIQGLVREDALITLLLINLDRRWEREIVCAPSKENGSQKWIETRDRIRSQITGLRDRKRAIAAETDAIFESDFWEIGKIERPPRPDIDPEAYQTILEEAENDLSDLGGD
jgi:hypothetical protein